MSLTVRVYDNGDHTCLVWMPLDGRPLTGCLGFAIRRRLNGKQDYLHGFVGFSDQQQLDPKNPWKFPIQRFMWWDYGVKPGDRVQYSVVPVSGRSASQLALDEAGATPLTPELVVTGQAGTHVSAYFNKGIIATQWVARELKASKASSIKSLVATPGNALREQLGGLLRQQILKLLADTQSSGGQIYAALYELNDPELLAGLTALGQRCHLILGNGAFKGSTAPGNDENHAVRESLRGHIDLHDRIVKPGHFAHNKFVIFCDAQGTAQRVLTGSTNWTVSGLCTQANNGLVIDDAAAAADFMTAWYRLKAAGDDYPAALVTGNSTARTLAVNGLSATAWFAKTSDAQDLDFARSFINGAKQGILFLFFNPGAFEDDPERWTLLQNILERHNSEGSNYLPSLYLRGVVNQEIPLLTEPGKPGKPGKPKPAVMDPSATTHPVALYDSGAAPPLRLGQDVLVPRNVKDQFHQWERELLGASMVNIHSKVIVIDPFGANPVVMTGSHNLGYKASSANDDNLVVIQGNAPLAAAYAVNIIAIYQTYRWNGYVEAHRDDPKVWHGPVANDGWQADYLQGSELAELKFWLGDTPPAGSQDRVAQGQGSAKVRSVAVSGQPGTIAPAPARKAKTRAPRQSKRGSPKPPHRRAKTK
ncbi:MAG TPA: phospholipase D-like domain-containing protein [Steroidobacteraceae bacterium]